jgi:hypothetical protein
VNARHSDAYEPRLKTNVTVDQPIRLKVAIEPSQRSQADPLIATEAIVPAAGSDGTVAIPWTSDRLRSFRVSIEVRADGGSARLLVSTIKATRV